MTKRKQAIFKYLNLIEICLFYKKIFICFVKNYKAYENVYLYFRRPANKRNKIY